ncbi:unnamed protein product [Urochloa humidicola]
MHGGRNGGQRGSCAALQLAGACTPAVVCEPAAALFGERLQPETRRRRRRPEVSRRPRRPPLRAAAQLEATTIISSPPPVSFFLCHTRLHSHSTSNLGISFPSANGCAQVWTEEKAAAAVLGPWL